MNKHIRIGIATGGTFGVAMAIAGYLRNSSLLSAFINALGGIFFGAIMAWFSSRGERRLKAMGIDTPSLSPIQSRAVNYPGDLQAAIEATKQAFQSIRKLKAVTETTNPPSLTAKTGFTFESFGESVTAEFSSGPAGTEIVVTSKPRISTTQMDMGKGVENVEMIVKSLSKEEVRAPVSPNKSLERTRGR